MDSSDRRESLGADQLTPPLCPVFVPGEISVSRFKCSNRDFYSLVFSILLLPGHNWVRGKLRWGKDIMHRTLDTNKCDQLHRS